MKITKKTDEKAYFCMDCDQDCEVEFIMIKKYSNSVMISRCCGAIAVGYTKLT